MADSDTEICNMALGHLGIDADIAALTTDRTPEARACRKFFSTTRRQTLRDYNWPFAKKFADLALVEEEPNDAEWGYSYRLPSDCLMARRVLNGNRNPSRDNETKFIEGADSSGSLIYTDQEDAVLEYTYLNSTATQYPDDFVMAMSLRLAAVIAPQLTGGDPFKLGVLCLQKYKLEMSMAVANAGNSQRPEEPPMAESIRARDE